MARKIRSVCSLRPSLNRLCTLATTKSKRANVSSWSSNEPSLKNVGLDAFEDAEALAVMLIQAVNLGVLLEDFLNR